jgi:hypothetical protein
MKLLSWAECDDKQEVLEGNRACFSEGITFYLNHDDNTALMNRNTASREAQLEACKFLVSLGYVPQEEVWNSGQ